MTTPTQCERCKEAIHDGAGEYSSAGELLCPTCFATYQMAEVEVRNTASEQRLRILVGVSLALVITALCLMVAAVPDRVVFIAMSVLGTVASFVALFGMLLARQSPSTGSSSRRWLLAFSLALLLGGSVLGVLGRVLSARLHDQILTPFRPHLASYLESVLHPSTADASFRGKLIVVDIGRRDFDNLYFDLPDHIAAKTPEEVRTIAVLTRSSVKVGSYRNGADAYVATCHVSVIDKDSRKVLRSRDFRGGQPPQETTSEKPVTGSSPDEAIVKFLASLQ